MLPFQPESTESICARVNKVLERCFDVEKIARGQGKRPGELREHIFDFEDRIRCIVSLDRLKQDRPVLHISCSSDWSTKLSLAEFMVRAQNMHSVFWPDAVLVEQHRTVTGKAIHLFYAVPDEFLKA